MEDKKYVLSSNEITKIASMAAKEGIDSYKREQEAKWEERTEHVRNSANPYHPLSETKEDERYIGV